VNIVKLHPRYASLLAVILAYGLLGFLLAPWLLEKNLVKTMQQDFDAELRVEKIEINPFALTLRINGLELDTPEEAPSIRVQEIFANFQLSSIFRLALTFEEIRLSSPEMFIARDESGILDLEYLTKSSNETSDDKSNEEDSDSAPVQTLVYNFIIEDFVVHWSDKVPADPVKTRFGPIAIDIKELNTIPARSGQQTVIIATEDSGTLSWSGDLQLNPFRSSGHALLEDSRFPLISAYIRHQTGVNIAQGSADIELEYEVYTATSGELQARIANLNLALNEIAVDSFADGTGFDFAGEDQRILRLPRVLLSGGQLQWPEQTISLESISIDSPQIDVSRDENGIFSLEPRKAKTSRQSVATTSESPTAPDAEGPSEDQWRVSISSLTVNDLALTLLDRTVNPEARLGVTDFNLDVSAIDNLPGSSFPASLSLQTLNGGELSAKGEFSILPSPLFNFDVGIEALQLAGLQPYIQQQANLSMNSGAINMNGNITGTEDDPFRFNGNVEVVDFNIAESIKEARLASWKSFHIDKIAFSVANRQLDISTLKFDQLYGDVLINKDGSLNVGQVRKASTDLGASETAEATAEVEVTAAKPAFKVTIGDISLENGSADFADLSLPLPFSTKIDALNGNMTTISTESIEPSQVSLEGKVDEFGFARVSGSITPLQPNSNTDIQVSFENIDVPSFTPYSIPFAGREIKSGKLDLKLGYLVKDNQLAGENSITLRDFELGEKVPHPDAMDVPLGLAVALLKDANGKIDIDLPVRGNLDDPEFSYGSVVMTALGRFLVKIVLYPFTALGGLLGIEASELEHVKFLDGRSDLTPPELEKAGKLAEALALRPELQLVIAGVSDAAADGLALRTSRLDETLEVKIGELTATSDSSIQYSDLRRMALEQLFSEQLTASAVTPSDRLEQLQMQFTAPVIVEGQTDPVPTLDSLAYANELRSQLIALQTIEEADLTALASARAESLRSSLIAIDINLQEQILIADNQAITRSDEEPIRMKVTLSGKTE